MYSKELEELIESALADGVITDKERAILHKRAKTEGVDCDELDMLLDGRLAKMKKKQASQIPVPPKPVESTKMGNVMRCPNCNAPYEPGTGKCPSCGHVFQNIDAIKSSVKLAEGIQNLIDNGGKKFFGGDIDDGTRTSVEEFIKNFPIPNAKDDLLDFIISLDTKRRDFESWFDGSYNTKYREAVNKARILFPGDSHLISQSSSLPYH